MKLAEIITDTKTNEVTFVLTNTMTCQNDNCSMPAYDYRDIIGTYCLEIMIALKKRMDNCLNTMLNPKNTILAASDLQVVFKKESGIVHCFNKPSYYCMGETLDLLSNGYFNKISKLGYDQILKAMYGAPRPATKNCITADNLITCLTELITNYENIVEVISPKRKTITQDVDKVQPVKMKIDHPDYLI